MSLLRAKLRVVLVLSISVLSAGILLALGGLVSAAYVPVAGPSIADGPQNLSGSPDDVSLIDASVTLTANCRYALAGGSPYADFIATQNTGVGWQFTFSAWPPVPNPLPATEFIHVVHVYQDKVKDNNGNYVYLQTYTPYPPAPTIASLVQSDPGALWIVGIEPDRGPNTDNPDVRVQDDTYPAMYATAYHDLYTLIKANDMTAQVAVAGLVEVTPGRLNYLDQVWQAYLTKYGTTMPVDVWNMHIYILPEANNWGTGPDNVGSVALGTSLAIARRENLGLDFSPTAQQRCYNSQNFNRQYLCWADHDDMGEFAAEVVAMRNWMKGKGQQNKPLILTEFGILYPDAYDTNPDNPYHCWVVDEFTHCFTPDRVSAFLHNSFNYLNTAQDASIGYPLDNNRLVQQWLWFNMNSGGYPGYVSNIVTPTVPMTFTQVGRQFMTDVSNPISYPQNINLFPVSTRPLGSFPNGASTTLMASIGVMNNGSIVPNKPVTVTVYADAARTQPIGGGTISGVRGCARREYPATVSFDVPINVSGYISYYVRVDPGNLAGETTMSDNDIAGTIFVYPNHLMLPLIRR